MLNPPSSRRSTRAGAFTLVELLIVIGIIAVLISILVPVVNAVRKSAYAADTRNQIQNVGNAIDRYYNDFSAYPGLFSNQAIAAGTPTVGGSAITGTESCVVSLMGGLSTAWVAGNITTDAGPFTYTASKLGQGPLTFNSVAQKRLAAYLEATPQTVSMHGSALDDNSIFGVGQSPVDMLMGVDPTGIPEFIDRYPGAMPIIYMRARVGATGVVGVDGTPAGATYQYDARNLLPYVTYTANHVNNVFAFDSNGSSGAFPSSPSDQANPSGNYPAANGVAYPSVNFAGSYNYFLNASTGTAKRQDSYMLISPGPDRKYGTSDDICNFAF